MLCYSRIKKVRLATRAVICLSLYGNDQSNWVENMEFGLENNFGRFNINRGWIIERPESPMHREAEACGVFTYINRLCEFMNTTPTTRYSRNDIRTLRNHIAAVISSGDHLPE